MHSNKYNTKTIIFINILSSNLDEVTYLKKYNDVNYLF